jgi:predicted ATP-grasp superfamily ATP-dependent carboligase
MEYDIPAVTLMSEAHFVPDPLAAAAVLNVLNEYLGLKVDVKKLVEQGRKVESQFKVLFEEMKKGKTGYTKMERFSPMYG